MQPDENVELNSRVDWLVKNKAKLPLNRLEAAILLGIMQLAREPLVERTQTDMAREIAKVIVETVYVDVDRRSG